MRLKELRKKQGLTQDKLAKKLNVSRPTIAVWENGTSQPNNEALMKLASLFDVSVDYLLERKESEYNPIRIPVLGNVAAGIPIDAIEDIVDWEEIPNAMAKAGEYFGLRIKGSSMEPRISEGDTVIVRRQHDVESGEIAIIIVNGDEGTCKKVLKHAAGGITLVSLNPAFEPRYLSPQEVEDLPVTIVGKVVELRGKF